jgi:hypothetical protein
VIGFNAGSSIVDGANNVIIGESAGSSTMMNQLIMSTGTYERLKINDSGYWINGSLQGSSDIKLKENVTVIENALDKVLQLNGVEFTWKKDGTRSAGVIAQDVEKVMPDIVREVDDSNYEEPYKAVKYDALHALLIESIKELKAEIDQLKVNK